MERRRGPDSKPALAVARKFWGFAWTVARQVDARPDAVAPPQGNLNSEETSKSVRRCERSEDAPIGRQTLQQSGLPRGYENNRPSIRSAQARSLGDVHLKTEADSATPRPRVLTDAEFPDRKQRAAIDLERMLEQMVAGAARFAAQTLAGVDCPYSNARNIWPMPADCAGCFSAITRPSLDRSPPCAQTSTRLLRCRPGPTSRPQRRPGSGPLPSKAKAARSVSSSRLVTS